jgi:hypothetical protein
MWVTINSVTNIIKYTGESKKRALFLMGKRGEKWRENSYAIVGIEGCVKGEKNELSLLINKQK